MTNFFPRRGSCCTGGGTKGCIFPSGYICSGEVLLVQDVGLLVLGGVGFGRQVLLLKVVVVEEQKDNELLAHL